MKDEIKKFWTERATGLMWEGPDLGTWQSTSLTSSEQEAMEVRTNEIKHLKKALKLIPHFSEMNALDVGCGTGRLTVFLAQQFKHIYATDYTVEFLYIAKMKAQERRITNISFNHLKSHEVMAEWEYDCCIMTGILQYLVDEDYFKTLDLIGKGKYAIVKESVGVNERLELQDHYSEELKAEYSAIYRHEDEIVKDIESLGYRTLMNQLVEAHRKETNKRIFVFEKK